ncbi:GntR family transcriptional regulator [Chelativorans salis]|uniref:GntR family transcriptional regulator n=1 Tax=Chelativorans salis TaxID=2978478 RepID=A0ABT2LL22_9HYPH|nr:GntR family transcriptional regulator [Chelativorans sp. EGI FJ00035]MCT7374088.1 GntR family transcriptional regulator [Chelativorans sp. EGI FJ00035]
MKHLPEKRENGSRLENTGKRKKASPDRLTQGAYNALVDRLRDGELSSGAFVTVPGLVEMLGFPLAAVREAVKRADAFGLLTVIPKRGVIVMDAGPETTRACLSLRALFDVEGARRLIKKGADLPLKALRADHEEMLERAQREMTPELPRQAIQTDLSLHDALSVGLDTWLEARLYDENRNRIAIIQNTRAFVPNRIVSAMEEHLAIIAALEARDGEAVAEAIRFHLQSTLQWWGVPEQGTGASGVREDTVQ